MTTKKNLMIDLETLGTFMNAPVVTIGACFFDPMTGEIGDKFYRKIDMVDAMRFGSASGDTLRWWLLGFGNQVEVLSGLSANEQYIVSAEGKLYNGANVQLAN